MKKIIYFDQEYLVPYWVNWIAIDEDGLVYGYGSMPEQFTDSWDEAAQSEKARSIPEKYHLGKFYWGQTLRKV